MAEKEVHGIKLYRRKCKVKGCPNTWLSSRGGSQEYCSANCRIDDSDHEGLTKAKMRFNPNWTPAEDDADQDVPELES